MFVTVQWENAPGPGDRRAFGIGGGGLTFLRYSHAIMEAPGNRMLPGWAVNAGPFCPPVFWYLYVPASRSTAFWIAGVVVPLWPLIVVAALPMTVISVRERRARRRASCSLCPACGYDRRGIPEGAPCPECGTVENRSAGAPARLTP
jgi:hypothetical protein